MHPAGRPANLMRWLRETHPWFGSWGAALGLLFGFSGVWLNHRCVLKLTQMAQQRSNVQSPCPIRCRPDPRR